MPSLSKGPTDRILGAAAPVFSPRAALAALRPRFAAALDEEWDLRRPFLWLPAAAGAGAIFYLVAPAEPALWVVGATAVLFGVLAFFARGRRALSAAFIGLAALAAGEFSGGWRAARVDAPVLDRIYIGELAGFVEEVDFRPQGARFLLRVAEAEGLAPEKTPFRVRLTLRGTPAFAAGDFLTFKARLLPPAARGAARRLRFRPRRFFSAHRRRRQCSGQGGGARCAGNRRLAAAFHRGGGPGPQRPGDAGL